MWTQTTALLIAFLCMALAAAPLLSQTTAQKPTFEVASIRPNDSGLGSSRYSCCTGGYFRASNVDLKSLMMNAYDLFEYQVVGGPDWLTSAHFDIQARGDPASNSKGMVRSLLEQRFELRIHRENRDLSVYVLTVAKGGPKLQPMPEGREGPNSTGTNTTPAGIELHGSGATIKDLINKLTKYVQRPIADQTNLTGKYDFTVKWSSSPANPASSTDSAIGPDIFTALPDQLGLKLESGKNPVELIVIDSVQKPTAN